MYLRRVYRYVDELSPMPITLSPMEKRVCALLLQGKTERLIAKHLERSHNTVHVHVRNIYRKLAVRTRQELFEFPGINELIVCKLTSDRAN